MARDSVQVQLEATEARILTLDQRLTERLDRIVEIQQKTEQTIDTLSNRIDALTVQVVQFNSGMTELKGLARQILQALDRQTDAINGHLRVAEEQTKAAQQQSTNINELSKLVATQAATVDFLIRRTAS